EKNRVVIVQYCPGEEKQMNARDPERNPGLIAGRGCCDASGRLFHGELREFTPERQEVNRIGNQNSDYRLPAEVQEHVSKTPIPFLGYHQNRRRGKMSERSTHRYAYEQQT